MTQDLNDQVRKLRDQVRALSRMIPEEGYPIDRLMISLDLGDDELYAATAIFEEYDAKLDENREGGLAGFEPKMRDALGFRM